MVDELDVEEDGPITEAWNGERCLFCLTDSNSLQTVHQIPPQYQAESVQRRQICLCESCQSSLDNVFDDNYFKNVRFYIDSDDPDGVSLDDFPGTVRDVHEDTSSDVCEVCGISDPRVIDRHHTYPRRHHPPKLEAAFKIANVCANCHRRIERLYDEYFFNRLGLEADLIESEESSSAGDSDYTDTRTLVQDFINKKCRFRREVETKSNDFMKNFYGHIESRGFKYNGGSTLALRIADELFEYTSWEHTPVDIRGYSETKYWNFGKFVDLDVVTDS